jgi:hypothetical protein
MGVKESAYFYMMNVTDGRIYDELYMIAKG